MLEYKIYFYYSKRDSLKEPLDRVQAFSKEEALHYFAKRKQMDEQTFLSLYEIKSR